MKRIGETGVPRDFADAEIGDLKESPAFLDTQVEEVLERRKTRGFFENAVSRRFREPGLEEAFLDPELRLRRVLNEEVFEIRDNAVILPKVSILENEGDESAEQCVNDFSGSVDLKFVEENVGELCEWEVRRFAEDGESVRQGGIAAEDRPPAVNVFFDFFSMNKVRWEDEEIAGLKGFFAILKKRAAVAFEVKDDFPLTVGVEAVDPALGRETSVDVDSFIYSFCRIVHGARGRFRTIV